MHGGRGIALGAQRLALDQRGDLLRVRHAVSENRLFLLTMPDDQISEALETTGRGGVIELDGVIVAFAVADAFPGGIGALFVDPRYRGQGYGRRLHDTVVEWLWAQERIAWLNAQPGSEA